MKSIELVVNFDGKTISQEFKFSERQLEHEYEDIIMSTKQFLDEMLIKALGVEDEG